MISDVVVIDAVAHALDLRPENWNNPAVCESFREFGYYGIHMLAVPPEEPQWGLGREGFDTLLEDTDVVESVIFRESWTDALLPRDPDVRDVQVAASPSSRTASSCASATPTACGCTGASACSSRAPSRRSTGSSRSTASAR